MTSIVLLFNLAFLNIAIGYYLITILQWHDYRLIRVLVHFARYAWHVYFILMPLFIYLISYNKFIIYMLVFGLPFLYLWHKKLDKKLIFTSKIKVFFALLAIFTFIGWFYELIAILPLIASLVGLNIYDRLINKYYTKKAKNKLKIIKNLNIILITASFGKTSIKNFLYEFLKDDYICYKTPRSVNTFKGIIKDINENLALNTNIYIVEAGAREANDIKIISEFLNPQICIIGQIGPAHLEYFKNIENIKKAKLKALNSNKLQKYFVHSSTGYGEKFYDENISDIKASLDGLSFDMKINDKLIHIDTKLLGNFHAFNIAACIKCALYLNINLEKIIQKAKNLKNIEHRLSIISKEPKFIIDDGFNGNLEGMRASYELCKTYKYKKILITPGIVEVGKNANIKLCEYINECFDLAIITGSINVNILNKYIKIKKIIAKDKKELINILAQNTKEKDLILFSNDVPSFM